MAGQDVKGGDAAEDAAARGAEDGGRSEDGGTKPEEDRDARLVQYVVLRQDLQKEPFSWPLGSMIAQGCHVVSKVLWELKEEANVVSYFSDIDSMHKVSLGAKNEAELRKVAEGLENAGIKHRLWIEQPEGIATALATMPYPRGEIAPFMKKLKLLK